MTKIPLKKIWIASSQWRGREEIVNSVCGCADCGTFPDSPANSFVAKNELGLAKVILRKNKIAYRKTTCRSSNVFCVHHYLVVEKNNVERAKELLKPLEKETQLFYVV